MRWVVLYLLVLLCKQKKWQHYVWIVDCISLPFTPPLECCFKEFSVNFDVVENVFIFLAVHLAGSSLWIFLVYARTSWTKLTEWVKFITSIPNTNPSPPLPSHAHMSPVMDQWIVTILCHILGVHDTPIFITNCWHWTIDYQLFTKMSTRRLSAKCVNQVSLLVGCL